MDNLSQKKAHIVGEQTNLTAQTGVPASQTESPEVASLLSQTQGVLSLLENLDVSSAQEEAPSVESELHTDVSDTEKQSPELSESAKKHAELEEKVHALSSELSSMRHYLGMFPKSDIAQKSINAIRAKNPLSKAEIRSIVRILEYRHNMPFGSDENAEKALSLLRDNSEVVDSFVEEAKTSFDIIRLQKRAVDWVQYVKETLESKSSYEASLKSLEAQRKEVEKTIRDLTFQKDLIEKALAEKVEGMDDQQKILIKEQLESIEAHIQTMDKALKSSESKLSKIHQSIANRKISIQRCEGIIDEEMKTVVNFDEYNGVQDVLEFHEKQAQETETIIKSYYKVYRTAICPAIKAFQKVLDARLGAKTEEYKQAKKELSQYEAPVSQDAETKSEAETLEKRYVSYVTDLEERIATIHANFKKIGVDFQTASRDEIFEKLIPAILAEKDPKAQLESLRSYSLYCKNGKDRNVDVQGRIESLQYGLYGAPDVRMSNHQLRERTLQVTKDLEDPKDIFSYLYRIAFSKNGDSQPSKELVRIHKEVVERIQAKKEAQERYMKNRVDNVNQRLHDLTPKYAEIGVNLEGASQYDIVIALCGVLKGVKDPILRKVLLRNFSVQGGNNQEDCKKIEQQIRSMKKVAKDPLAQTKEYKVSKEVVAARISQIENILAAFKILQEKLTDKTTDEDLAKLIEDSKENEKKRIEEEAANKEKREKQEKEQNELNRKQIEQVRRANLRAEIDLAYTSPEELEKLNQKRIKSIHEQIDQEFIDSDRCFILYNKAERAVAGVVIETDLVKRQVEKEDPKDKRKKIMVTIDQPVMRLKVYGHEEGEAFENQKYIDQYLRSIQGKYIEGSDEVTKVFVEHDLAQGRNGLKAEIPGSDTPKQIRKERVEKQALEAKKRKDAIKEERKKRKKLKQQKRAEEKAQKKNKPQGNEKKQKNKHKRN